MVLSFPEAEGGEGHECFLLLLPFLLFLGNRRRCCVDHHPPRPPGGIRWLRPHFDEAKSPRKVLGRSGYRSPVCAPLSSHPPKDRPYSGTA